MQNNIARDVLARAGFSTDAVLVSALAPHVEAVIFNVGAMAATMAAMKGEKKIGETHVAEVRAYIDRTCKMSGGSALPSDYFGVMNPAYSAMNAGGTVMSQINFAANIARPELVSQLGGGRRRDPIAAKLREVVKEHGAISLPRDRLQELVSLVHRHLSCLAADLRSAGETLTVKKLKKVLAMKRHAVFH